ncbi:Pr6Pr family membrane protein [Devosia naphthalenivorans]|uniref:Pr6Pr family membrane protein n=1 Tax=Devosia naphthalenivorans TaxID=2082392 RepID=UPI000D33BC6A|nr:Pr6Pr family membrane protein [Devosia naphthalenivorans]
MGRAPVNPRKLLTGLGLAAGTAGLLIEFVFSMQISLATGRDIPGALGSFFAFYTILTNIVLVLIYLSEVLPTQRLAIFRHPVTRGSMVACITLVSLYVFFVLRHLYAPTGLLELSDRLLHYVAPLLYLLWWVIGQPHGQLRWGNLPVMLLPTLIYFVAVMLRGAWLHRYPYPFMNIDELGIGAVLLGALFMAAGLAALSALVIALDHFLTRNWNLVHE